jgi:hypothetical protein
MNGKNSAGRRTIIARRAALSLVPACRRGGAALGAAARGRGRRGRRPRRPAQQPQRGRRQRALAAAALAARRAHALAAAGRGPRPLQALCVMPWPRAAPPPRQPRRRRPTGAARAAAGPNPHGADGVARPRPAPEWTPAAAAALDQPRRPASPRARRPASPHARAAAEVRAPVRAPSRSLALRTHCNRACQRLRAAADAGFGDLIAGACSCAVKVAAGPPYACHRFAGRARGRARPGSLVWITVLT